jgi:hypothetical protein
MAVVNHQVRMDGGAPIDKGLTLTHAFTPGDLAAHDFSVRSEDNEGNFSDWATINAAALDPSASSLLKINGGGGAERGWIADTGLYTAPGGGVHDFASNTLHLANGIWQGISAPTNFLADETIYRYLRYSTGGTITYNLTGFIPWATHTIRLHIYGSAAQPINQTISINGVQVKGLYGASLQTFTIEEFDAKADSSGNFQIVLDGTALRAGVSGIEVMQPIQGQTTMLFALGDSITDYGGTIGAANTWPAQLATAYAGNQGGPNPAAPLYVIGYDEDALFTARMLAVAGTTIADQTPLLATGVSNHAGSLWDRQVVFLLAGTNDIAATRTLVQMQDDVTDFFNAIPANVTHKGVGTVTEFGVGDVVRDAFNAWLLANSLGFDFVCDFDAAMPDRTDLTYFDPDGTHPSVGGCTVRKNMIKAAIDAL